MEFIIVTFPARRAVRMDGLPFGRTGTKKRIEAGHHRFDLGPDEDYTPPFDERNVIGTTFETPLVIPFTPLPAEAVIPAARPRAAGRKGAAPKRATAKRSRKRLTPTAKTARATKRRKRARKTSRGRRTKK